jgi:hypothetical protein
VEGGELQDLLNTASVEGGELQDLLNTASVEGGDLQDLLNTASVEGGDNLAQGSLESEENISLDELPELGSAAPTSHNFVMGNKARKGGRDTAFYQVLNVSEGWHRNRALTKKEDQKLLRTKEMLAEQLDGKGCVRGARERASATHRPSTWAS